MERKERAERVIKLLSEGKRIIAIDGRAGSGKSTLAQDTAERMDVNIIRLDDFFLPPSLRTKERFSTPGGNVHWERFLEEVVEKLELGVDFSYRIFSCSRMDYYGEKEIDATKPIIVEGSYALHPSFPVYWDYSFFLDVEKDEQLRRIFLRSPEKIEDFKNKWIPLEESYFSSTGAPDRADERM